MLTITERVVLPPLPAQVSPKVLVATMELIVWLPIVDLTPDHAPVALQLEAPLEDHVSSVEPPDSTVFGDALSETTGAAAGDPGGGVLLPPLSPDPAPPQAARLNAH